MPRDPIVEEVRAIRDRLAARFNYDIRAMAEDARKRQGQDGREVVSLQPKRPKACMIAVYRRCEVPPD